MRCASTPGVCFITLGLILLALGTLSVCSPERRPVRDTQNLFQSVCQASLYDHASQATLDELWTGLRKLDQQMSMWKPDSEVSRLSEKAGEGPIRVSTDLFAVLERGVELSRLSGGRYDPTVGPLVKLWAIGTPEARVPSHGEILDVMKLVNWQDLRIDHESQTVELIKGGMVLDFGSQAKGYAAREAGRILVRRGVRSAIVDIGGCVIALGMNREGKPWRIGIQDPGGERGSSVVGYLLAHDEIASTSGIYERHFIQDGRLYHHIMDTQTGYPVDNEVVAVTVLCPRDDNPDGPTLAFLAMGVEKGLALANRMGLCAVFLLKDRSIVLSQAADGRFILTDEAYRIDKAR